MHIGFLTKFAMDLLQLFSICFNQCSNIKRLINSPNRGKLAFSFVMNLKLRFNSHFLKYKAMNKNVTTVIMKQYTVIPG